MKGHCEIILSEQGKEVLHTHDDNVVTNALAELFGLAPEYYFGGDNLRYEVYSSMLPIATSGTIGGVALLKNAITGEDEELQTKTVIPIGSGKITGHSGKNTSVDTADMSSGLFNENESGQTGNGYRYVWDFPTDRGNGDIECVCLTSDKAGRSIPLNQTYISSASAINTNIGQTIGVEYIVLGVNSNNELVFVKSSSSINKFYLAKLNYDIGLFDELLSANKPLTTLKNVREITTESTFDINNMQFTDMGIARVNDGYLYVYSSHTLDFVNSYHLPDLGYKSGRTWFVNNGYFYGLSYDGTKIHKVNLSDLTDYSSIELETPTTALKFYGKAGGKMILSVNPAKPENSFLFDGVQLCKAKFTIGDYSSIFISEIGNYQYYIQSYLSSGNTANIATYSMGLPMITIDNLETPVTKTTAQTMKVIYTITQGDTE